MSNDLEQLLRRTLDNRAADVTTGPRWNAPVARRRRWIAPLAAAAAVGGIAVAAVLIPQGHNPQAPPQTRPPTPVTTTTPPPTGGLHAATCSAPLPAAWQTAIAAGVLPASAGTLTPLSMTPTGELLARRTSGGHDQLVLVRPDRSTSVVYTAPTLRIALAAADQQWIMVAQTQPGAPYAIDAIKRSSGAVTEVRAASVRPDAIVQAPVLFQNAIYWTEGNQYGVGDVRSFDLSTRTIRILDHGYVSRPVTAGGGLFWLKADAAGNESGRLVTAVPGTLPPGFELLPWKTYGELAQDRKDFAWGSYVGPDPSWEFRVWTPGAPAVTVFPPSQAGAGEVPAIAMPYLFARGRVVDLGTGASAPMSSPVQFAADGVLAVEVGHRLSIVRTAQLPEPRC